ncbi:MAG: 30S ribosomal protein S9 [Thermoplasmatales archaeon]|nr:30S ribosomal protein S9 [Candidatus Thermoplasmatota archaeon]MCL5983257.1 30S ribosomal protein S9 [Candidatus Thermoplasmatota archaeon]MCW6167594.1 30S ribosomal protein S9 [Thermoplasmatales archaeon]
MKAPQVVLATGKRKEAIARATIRKGRGLVRINDRPLELVEPELVRFKIQEPLLMVGDRWKTIDIAVDIQGGGVMGQASAARTAIARGLLRWLKDPALDEMFKHYDRSLIVNDPRRKLPKRPGGRGARARRQKSYR